uniref:helix-turn-helix domain-containing protein n=1 Tax=Acetatifactor sp. TaxID=1872090 RepID=UPI0040564BEC
MTLGERIKRYRHMQGLSQEELAEKLNVSRQAITKWENNNGVPDIDNLIALSKIMGISLDELVRGEKEEDVSLIKKESANQRIKDCKSYLISAIGFSVAAVCWFISCILNIVNSNDTAAVLNLLTIMILCVPISMSLKNILKLRSRRIG